MAEAKFNIRNTFTLRGEGGNSTLNIGAFRGSASLTVFADNRKVTGTSFTPELIMELKRTFSALRKAAPNTRVSLTISVYNRDLKKSEVQMNIVLGKDEKQVMYIEITPRNGSPMVFAFRGSRQINAGVEPMSDADRSIRAVDAFFWTIDHKLPSDITASSYGDPDEFQQNRGGQQRGGYGGQRNNSGGGGSRPAPVPSGGEDTGGSDDLY